MHFLFFIVFPIALYFLPTIVANSRGVRSAAGVFVLNLFLGWTLVGWVVALAWAVSGETRYRYYVG
jgi:hypothetical protein